MHASIFHKLLFMMMFEGDKFEPTSKYDKEWSDWLDDATGQQRCIGADWRIEDIDITGKNIVIGYNGEDSHSGAKRRGMIFTNLDGEVKEVVPWE